jgi:DNA-binding transcriptional MerR regulator
MERILSIGEVARQAGVSVQTLRHYDKLGLLVPSKVTAAGYRQYTEGDCARLALIRALRDTGFDLRTIAQLLDSQQDPAAAMRLQIEALAAQQRALKRQQLILQAAVNGDAPAGLSSLQRKNVLAQLNKLEREAFLAQHLGWRASENEQAQAVWRAAIFDLPEDMNEAQLEAWLELAEIAADPHYRQTLERQWQLPPGLDAANSEAWRQSFQALLADAVDAVRMGRSPDDPASQALLDAWVQSFAEMLARPPDVAFKRWVVAYLDSIHDPRIVRYWELVAQIKGWQHDPINAQAFAWLMSGLRAGIAPYC